MMKRTAVLVNTSSGPVIDQRALFEVLRAGSIGGAGLDVFEVELLDPVDPTRGLDNVVLTPHTAVYSEESSQKVRGDVRTAVREVLAGRRPSNVINAAVWRRQTATSG